MSLFQKWKQLNSEIGSDRHGVACLTRPIDGSGATAICIINSAQLDDTWQRDFLPAHESDRWQQSIVHSAI